MTGRLSRPRPAASVLGSASPTPRLAPESNSPPPEPRARAREVAAQFALSPPIAVADFAQKGNINYRSFIVEAQTGPGPRRRLLLQQINDEVFTRPRAVMAAMLACIEAQRTNIARGALQAGEEWEPVTLIPTRGGDPYLEIPEGIAAGCWRLMVWIEGARSYKSLAELADPAQRLLIAEQAGAGLALFGTLAEGIDFARLSPPLPGYRDTRLYYDQLLSVLDGNRTLEQAQARLPADPEVREATARHFLQHLPPDEARRRVDHPAVRPFLDELRASEEAALLLANEMQAGRIRRTVIHGDTKLENFLFDAQSGRVRSLIDLDTIMAQTWLSDWGDMVRSFCNVAGEKEARLDRVQIDMDIFAAVARGFLRSARNVTPRELELLVDGVQIIALELGMRFLTDYLRGDSYFKLGPHDPPDLNKIRGLCQLTLWQRLRERDAELRELLAALR
jgi:hypothetical protein